MSEKNTASGVNNDPSISNAEKQRIIRDVYRPDIEKLKLFTRMLRQNALFKKAKIIHK
jgi:hypothetical protein